MSLEIIKADITKMEVDAVVNAANNSLLGGGGVDGAIHRAAGPELLKECIALSGCETGDAKVTAGYNLLSKFIIHTVGPVWRGGKHNEEALLISCYKRCIEEAKKRNVKSIAFPLISAGVYGYPKKEALLIAARTISSCLSYDMKAFIVLFDEEIINLAKNMKAELSQYAEKTNL
ncbi:MAG TPA: O-acetyl-ADP-ribose deacetylase [Candidatus Ornithospirochaeta avicola]|uniref:O-acetyl-ADP-ribose deacetylase n=1 Tax=Candidatus Ornithospirochaeta avicola TaxID=2840896 RepID=A0A9D1PST3_9SPIO|nr:O-acetyl-ADP-ribose deacetylase [Candidatus Ornithospirochaeta avicola]